MLAFAAAVYLNGGLGAWDALFAIALAVLAYGGLASYRLIGGGWLIHAVWDLLNFGAGHALISGDLMSNVSCAIFDTFIAFWFFVEAPSVVKKMRSLRGRRQS